MLKRPVIDHVIITEHNYEPEKQFEKEMDREIRKIKKEEKKKIKTSFEKGEIKGIGIGKQKKAIEVAQRMLSKNYPIEEITGLTNLSKEEIILLGK
jgi:predicted transposase/invertase (TIGR01784 family)